jgi:AcrR family transcriptional regulator
VSDHAEPPTKAAGARPRGGGVRSEYKALTRQRLTEAAIAEFEETGYARCTIEDVAKRAGTSRATFYVHFSSKVELVEGLWDVVRRSLIQLYRELARLEVRDSPAIEAWMLRTFAFYAENRQRLLAIHEAIALETDLAEVYFARTNEVVDLVAPLIREDHVITDESARFRAALLTMQHERFCFFWILRQMPFDRDEAVRTLTQVWFEHLGHPGPPVPLSGVDPETSFVTP